LKKIYPLFQPYDMSTKVKGEDLFLFGRIDMREMRRASGKGIKQPDRGTTCLIELVREIIKIEG
jgi:hypothetical protein